MNTLTEFPIGTLREKGVDSVLRLTGTLREIVKSLLTKQFNINSLELEKREKLELIKSYLEKRPEFFEEFIRQNPEILKGNYIEENLEYYERAFLEIVEPALKDCYLEYEKIVDSEQEILYNEGLFRTNQNNIKYFEVLDIYTKLGKSIEIAYTVLERLISDIKNGNTKIPASINIEVSDFLDPEFIDKFEGLLTKYELEVKENMIIFEILENKKIEDSQKFRESLERVNNMGISIAFDDTMQIGSHLEDIAEIRKVLEEHKGIKIIKICGKYLQKLYNEHQNGNHDNYKKVTEFVIEIRAKGFYVVGEWIETKEHLMFAKSVLGVSHFQGYYFKENNN